MNTDVARHSMERRAAGRGDDGPSSWEVDKIIAALRQGMDPDDVGRLVLDAILTDAFWARPT